MYVARDLQFRLNFGVPTYVSGMPVSLGTMSRSDSAFTMSSMSMGGRSESFTITLGAQMKAMHNLRFVR